jgi:tRNA modification GTPase
MFSTSDTIVAPATATGRGALAVVRLSGPEAHSIGCKLLGRREGLRPRLATFARMRASATAETPAIDQVVATFFPAPHSYTSEDVVEVSTHGSPVLVSAVLSAAVAAGARLAQPGEFTFRAYVHGRLDLTQAEAVADLIDAVTPSQARAAFEQLEGSVGRHIAGFSARLLDLVARLEASLDFPDEGYHFADHGEVARELQQLHRDVATVLGDGPDGQLLREGACVVIAGRPNTGKSSLFNSLLGTDRAIVTGRAGTTRDLLIESIDLNGVPITLVDTAGERDVVDEAEAEGVRRAIAARDRASLVILVLDRSKPLADEDRELLTAVRRAPQLIVANKADLPDAWGLEAADIVGGARSVSALTGHGIDGLRSGVIAALGGRVDRDEPPRVTNVRHIQLLRTAESAIVRAYDLAIHSAPEEIVLIELNEARLACEDVTGRRSADDVLAHIFERFCIGK